MSQTVLRELYVRRANVVPELAAMIFSQDQSALSLQLLKALKEDQSYIVKATVNPLDYTNADAFRRDYLMTEMFSKYPNWDLKIDRKMVALQKFADSESKCGETNTRLASSKAWPYGTAAVIHTACSKIANLLNPRGSEFSWDEACVGFDFGPGSTTRLRKTYADKYYKLSGTPDCTSNNLPLANACLRYFSNWGRSVGINGYDVNVVVGNKIVTVPKNAKTDRVIAIEPCMNIFVQKGIGSMIRKRLKKVGVDLDDQTKNQRLALAGSLDGSLATLDLSAASDSISLELVRMLLPPDWVAAIESCRSERGVLPDGRVITYRKVSSMGNGFTFELESLIFWALCSAVRSLRGESDRRMAIYGDDIIVPTSLVVDVVSILEFTGFQVNEKKTHVDGPFRESCGKHYFHGVDVTPIYIKDNVDSFPRYIWLCNQLKRWSFNQTWGCDPALLPIYEWIRSKLGKYWSRPRIPDGLGDGALIGNFDEVLPKRASRGQAGWTAHFFTEMRVSRMPDDHPILLKSLFRLEKSPISGGSLLRFKTSRLGKRVIEPEGNSFLSVPTDKRRYSISKRAVWQWPDLGPWLV